jgi:integrase
MSRAIEIRKKVVVGSDIVSVPMSFNPTADPITVLLTRYNSDDSRKACLASLRAISRLLGQDDLRAVPWKDFTYPHVQAIRAKLTEKYAPSSARRHLSMLKELLRECWRLNLIPHETWARIDDVEGISGELDPAGRALSRDEIRALFSTCDPETYDGALDAAILSLGYFGGLRHKELVSLQFDDFNVTSGDVRVRGKGNKVRHVQLATIGKVRVCAWIKHRNFDPGNLLWGPYRRKRLTYSYVDARLVSMRLRAGIAPFTAHDLRRSFVTHLIENTGDFKSAQKAAGHSRLETTLRYDRRGDKAVIDATASLGKD